MLKPHFTYKSFADNSGTVFFNVVTGETIAVELTPETLAAILTGLTEISPESDMYDSLSKVLTLPRTHFKPS